MSSARFERIMAFRNDPTDKRHGTNTGYTSYGCRCERCVEAGRAAGRASYRRQCEKKIARIKEAREASVDPFRKKPEGSKVPATERREKAAARAGKAPQKDVCTIPRYLLRLMDKPSIKRADGRCLICGRPAENAHHIVKRSAGKWVTDGREHRKPTVELCGMGNASGCHGLAHQGRLHFRWVDQADIARHAHEKCAGAGHWEYKLFKEPCSVLEAWSSGEDGWVPCR